MYEHLAKTQGLMTRTQFHNLLGAKYHEDEGGTAPPSLATRRKDYWAKARSGSLRSIHPDMLDKLYELNEPGFAVDDFEDEYERSELESILLKTEGLTKEELLSGELCENDDSDESYGFPPGDHSNYFDNIIPSDDHTGSFDDYIMSTSLIGSPQRYVEHKAKTNHMFRSRKCIRGLPNRVDNAKRKKLESTASIRLPEHA